LPNFNHANVGTDQSVSEKIKKNMMLRIISAMVLAPLALAAVYSGGLFYQILIGLMGLILISEWFNIVGHRPKWLGLGVVYVALSVWALWRLRIDPEWGAMTVFWLVGVVWGADTGGYLFGMSIGGPKLAPAVSPKKTWSGFLGGTLMAALAGWAVVSWYGSETDFEAAALEIAAFSAAMAVVSQLGDLFESWIKRRYNVKDSGWIIPGHGGLFDRVDGLMAVAIVVALINIALQVNVLVWLS